MTTLITGSDSSLGSVLVEFSHFSRDHEQILGIPMKQMQNKHQIEMAIDEALSQIPNGLIDRVINNYGVNHLSWIGKTDLEDGEIIWNNVLAPYWVINHLVKYDQVCRVVNVASATYRVPQRCTSLYCASKAALVQLTKVMARELAPKGWVINAIAPGAIEDTEMFQKTNQQVLQLRGWNHQMAEEYAKNMIPMGRYTSTMEVSDAIWKMFDLPEYINGTVIDCMGGV